MKFGLESEKFIFNLKSGLPSRGVFRFLDALTDYQRDFSRHEIGKTTNEFVLNMVELGTAPSHSPMEVLKEYLFHYLLLNQVALRENVTLTPLASLPMNFLPQMTPKWSYFVQNSILAGRKQTSWVMNQRSPLKGAGNCAGIHVHAEIQTPPEFLYSTRELQDKFNLGLMLTPMIAFSSSPYFYGKHEASSMRGVKYYQETYKKFPLNGGLPDVMNSSIEVLNNFQNSSELWVESGMKLGFQKTDLQKLISVKGANWNPVRWNRAWNTVEIRCLESDSIDLDGAKFVWVCAAYLRLQNENLKCEPLKSRRKLDKGMVKECFQVSGDTLSILSSEDIREIFNRAVLYGTKDPLVEIYLHRIAAFVEHGIDPEYKWVFKILKRVLDSHQTTSNIILQKTRGKKKLSQAAATDIVFEMIERQNKIINAIKKHIPETFQLLEETGSSFKP